MKLKVITVIALLPILNACSIFSPLGKQATQWRPSEQYRPYFASDGRLSVSFDGKGYSAHFDWQKQVNTETLAINTPLGSTVGEICKDQQGVIAVSAKEEIYTASDITELSTQLLGFELPLEFLSYWAQGVTVPDQPYKIDQNGVLSQMDWRIKRFEMPEQSINAPKRLELINQKMDIRIVFDEFSFSPATTETSQCQARNKGQ